MSASNGGQGAAQISVWLYPVELAGLDQGRDDGPVLGICIVDREERVFAV